MDQCKLYIYKLGQNHATYDGAKGSSSSRAHQKDDADRWRHREDLSSNACDDRLGTTYEAHIAVLTVSMAEVLSSRTAARAMELFLQRLCSKSSEIAAQRKAKTLTTSHLWVVAAVWTSSSSGSIAMDTCSDM